MATPLGRTNSPLTGSELERFLLDEPQAMNFFQAVRGLERFSGREPVGHFTQPSEESVRFAGHPSLGFPPSEIRSLEAREDLPPLMRVNFFGLYGAMGVLPDVYTEFIHERALAKDVAFQEFLDLFNHRLVSFVYRAWLKNRFGVEWERTGDEPITRVLRSILGLGTPSLQDRQVVPDVALMFFAGLLACQVRSSAGLESLVSAYFDVEAQVIAIAGSWRQLDSQSQTRIGLGGSSTLGEAVILGDEVWDQQSTVRLRVGPLTLERYETFLPGAKAHGAVKSICRFYCGESIDVELQLVLQREEVPPLGLETEGAIARLGWVSWISSQPPAEHKDDAVFLLSTS